MNQNVAGNQERPWVDRDSLGRFVVAWQSYGQDGSSWGVFARRFDAAGTPLSNEFRANTHTPSFQERPAVATAADGRFMVVWQSGSQDGPSFGTFGQRYDANGAAVGPRAGDGAAGTPGSPPAEETGAPPGRGRMALGVGGSLRGGPGDPDEGVARVGGPAREADPRGAASAEGGGGGDRRALQDLTPEQKARLQEQLERSAEAYAALTAEQKEVVLSNLADTIDRLRSRTPAQKGKPQGALPEAARAVIGP